VVGHLSGLAAQHARWATEYRQDPAHLADDVRALLEPLGLLRVAGGYDPWWWLSPAAARWSIQPGPAGEVHADHVEERLW